MAYAEVSTVATLIQTAIPTLKVVENDLDSRTEAGTIAIVSVQNTVYKKYKASLDQQHTVQVEVMTVENNPLDNLQDITQQIVVAVASLSCSYITVNYETKTELAEKFARATILITII